MATDTPNPDAEQPAEETPQEAENYAPDELESNKVAGDTPGADVNLDLVLEVPVNVALQVGSTDLPIRELVKLVEGSVIALDRESTEAMDVLVNGKLIAHGEIVIVDEQFGVRLTDVVSPVERIEKIG
ncbi:MAG: flagellar motor switch protein FliN [Gammaproteobacteria bacterium]|nr:flagellar motor switch protein FliN [Gammaproteobacteria bacterium]